MPSPRPRIFVGSSRESITLIDSLQDLLKDHADIINWRHAGFALSRSFLENIEDELNISDFGIFIFSGDDEIISRGQSNLSVRDNVLLEFGVFLGALGRERTFIVAPEQYGSEIRITTDLLGITVATYRSQSINSNSTLGELNSILGVAANAIKDAVRRLKRRPCNIVNEPRVAGPTLSRGCTEYINIIADAALFVGTHRHEYATELIRRLKNNEVVPMKYLYRTEQASNHWLNICRRESYLFYRNSLETLRKHSKDIVLQIINMIGENEIDLISLGSGNGEKDNILIRRFINHLEDDEYIYYYPVDISDTLIEEAVKNSIGRGIDRRKIRTKALMADFNQLSELQKIYEERPANNVFSVLGNTIGNSDEPDLIRSIADSMLPGDIVIIEVNTAEVDNEDNILREPDNMLHDFAPLASLGIVFEEEKLTYQIASKQSTIDDTKSVLAQYSTAVIGGEKKNDIILSIVHHYNFDKFKKAIEDRINVKIFYALNEHGVGIIAAQRAKAVRSRS